MKTPWALLKLSLCVSLIRHCNVRLVDTSDGGLFQYSCIIKGVIYSQWYQKSQLFLSLVTFSHFTIHKKWIPQKVLGFLKFMSRCSIFMNISTMLFRLIVQMNPLISGSNADSNLVDPRVGLEGQYF